MFRDDPRFADLVRRFGGADAPALRAVILVTAVRVSDSCGFAVPLMDYREDRSLHADFFARKTDEEFAAYCESKEYVGTSVDALPALPLPLPQRAST